MTAAPDGYSTVQPWLVSRDTGGLLDFITAAFAGAELARIPTEDGGIGHAEIKVGDSILLAFDARPEWPPTPSMLRVYVDDADQAVQRAVEAGARVITPLSDAAWGDRGGRVRDPFGNIWWVIAHVEDVAPEEIGTRLRDPKYTESMRLAQETLDKELGGEGWSSRPVL
jgi:PhnB protein